MDVDVDMMWVGSHVVVDIQPSCNSKRDKGIFWKIVSWVTNHALYAGQPVLSGTCALSKDRRTTLYTKNPGLPGLPSGSTPLGHSL